MYPRSRRGDRWTGTGTRRGRAADRSRRSKAGAAAAASGAATRAAPAYFSRLSAARAEPSEARRRCPGSAHHRSRCRHRRPRSRRGWERPSSPTQPSHRIAPARPQAAHAGGMQQVKQRAIRASVRPPRLTAVTARLAQSRCTRTRRLRGPRGGIASTRKYRRLPQSTGEPNGPHQTALWPAPEVLVGAGTSAVRSDERGRNCRRSALVSRVGHRPRNTGSWNNVTESIRHDSAGTGTATGPSRWSCRCYGHRPRC